MNKSHGFSSFSLFEKGQHPLDNEWIALDLETTGLDPYKDDIIEIGAVRFNQHEILDTFQSLVNPNRKLGSFTKRFTGISQEEVDSAPSFDYVSTKLISFINDSPIVGHNISFDLGFLENNGIKLTNPRSDTLDLAYILKPCEPEYNLAKIAESLSISHSRPHRALNDAKITATLFQKLVKDSEELDPGIISKISEIASKSNWVLSYIFERLAAYRSFQPKNKKDEIDVRPINTLDMANTWQHRKHQNVLRPNDSRQKLDDELIDNMFGKTGPLANTMVGFEERSEQKTMAKAISEALNLEQRLIVEAGTGVGKSAAYLLPAILYSLKNNLRIIISTNTINLQEQLLEKDIPQILSALEDCKDIHIENFNYTLLKGRSNYVCLKKWSQLESNSTLSVEESKILSKLLVWSQTTTSGDRNELNLSRNSWSQWERVSAQSAFDCNGINGTCFLRSARDRAAAAHVVIVNHSLLISDLMTDRAVIPEHDILIIDEAQHLEKVATENLGFSIHKNQIPDDLDLLVAQGGLINGILLKLKVSKIAKTRYSSIEEALFALKDIQPKFIELIETLFSTIDAFILPENEQKSNFVDEQRITKSSRTQPAWSEIEILWQQVDVTIGHLESLIENLTSSLSGLEDKNIFEETLLVDIYNILERTRFFRIRISEIIPDPGTDSIYWASRSPRVGDIRLSKAPLHVGDILEKHLYSQNKTIVLTAATLSTNGDFGHIVDRFGFVGAEELLLGSPFNYPEAALLCVPSDIPEPSSPDYQAAVEHSIIESTISAGGSTLALFTSYSSLKKASRALKPTLEPQGFEVLTQGVDGSPNQIIKRFINNPNSVLLGTSSFWEGVDIAGDSLKVLLLARLPFPVPNDPIFDARSELYENAFQEYSIPQAILRLRQGFGRLIRTSKDRGVVIVLDKRLVSRSYGKKFITSLPPVEIKTPYIRQISDEIKDWLNYDINS